MSPTPFLRSSSGRLGVIIKCWSEDTGWHYWCPNREKQGAPPQVEEVLTVVPILLPSGHGTWMATTL